MKKTMAVLLAVYLYLCTTLALAQTGVIITGSNRKTFTPSCSLPPTTYYWTPTSNAGGTGNAGMADAVGSNPATQTTTASVPTYSATGGPNSVPILTFDGSNDFLNFATAIPTGAADTATIWALVSPSSTANGTIIGGATLGTLGYTVIATHQRIYSINSAVIATGTAVLSTGSWYLIAMTFQGTGTTATYAAYKISGGSYVTDITAMAAGRTTGTPVNAMGLYGTTYANFRLGAVAYYNGVYSSAQLTALATCASSTWGI